MFDSALQVPSLLGGDFADRWRTNQRILHLEDQLGRAQHELEVLRDTTAQMLTAMLITMQRPMGTADTAAAQIRKLADLGDASCGVPADDPITAEIESFETDDGRSLARLDRRFRWLPGRSK